MPTARRSGHRVGRLEVPRTHHEALIMSEQHAAEARESFKQEASASWTTYQETGLHLTGEEVRAWLRTWGTVNETGLPDCHT
ncbi:hypothetical protein L0Z02_29840 (plasmid) [Burkholderia multivorans]|nr:hypothetical protein [Burkholderia multivorans]MCO1460009.1 hypothetical protein [Burkholderia multivorans]UQO21376.1 hypothetical protein L0Z02_29840 [Burkholderia multivorans]UQO87516.1 hypothetical protein L0Y86_29570 [Burkholderia multivorans]